MPRRPWSPRKADLGAGRWIVAPQANLAEPTLQLVLLRRSGRLAVLRHLAALVLGRLARRDDVMVLRCRSARIRRRTAGGTGRRRDRRRSAGYLADDRPLYLVRP